MYLIIGSTRDGRSISKGINYSKRSGLFQLFLIDNKTQSQEFQSELKTIFKGFLLTVDQEVQKSNEWITTGNVPLSFTLYKDICGWMLQDDSASKRFAHTFLVLLWNLACQSSNMQTIHHHFLA